MPVGVILYKYSPEVTDLQSSPPALPARVCKRV